MNFYNLDLLEELDDKKLLKISAAKSDEFFDRLKDNFCNFT